MSKGSWRRPSNVTPKRFEESWDRIFGASKLRNEVRKKEIPVSGVPYPVDEDKLPKDNDGSKES